MILTTALAAMTGLATAQTTVPDPLVAQDGTRIETAAQWREKRRPELLEFFAKNMYGRAPERPKDLLVEVFDRDPHALGDKATRLQMALYPGGKSGPRLDLLVYLPNQVKGPVPAVLGLNFWGNQAIHPDPGIRITESWIEENRQTEGNPPKVQNHRATEASRGLNAKQWPVERILSHGFALATMYREDVAPDHEPYFSTGLQALYPEFQKGDENFGCMGAWAWSLSLALDALEKEPAIDAKKVALFGWSRLGKAALWAGARDERFAAVISNESGAGGAKLFHRGVGEDIERLNRVFPHWFARSFKPYAGKDTELPFDQHLVLSLIAPRPLYVGSAIDDKSADAEGEYASVKAAGPVYKLLGGEPLPAETWPAVDQAVLGKSLAYHVRTGKHDVLDFDWDHYLEFLDQRLK
ncbi:acetylxylan esterase [Luteolibacter sp. LG18]|nr:acetylxylan esterase [Luteolibacter sp. LG18]